MVRMSRPSSSRCVANEWRRVCRALRDPSPERGVLDDLLENGLVQVMPAHLAGVAIAIEACGREDPLPEPVAPGARILAGERGRQLDPAGARLDVTNVLLAERCRDGEPDLA